ncbi:MAG TPA: hypothetical protein VIY69_11665 [Candidatus Acidoferrales bacterium]
MLRSQILTGSDVTVSGCGLVGAAKFQATLVIAFANRDVVSNYAKSAPHD